MVRLRVAVRVRPPEPGRSVQVTCDERVSTKLAVRLPHAVSHEFAAVLGPSSSQADAYAQCGAPMLREAFEGNDSLLFAYGQVGSGKTYTLYGAEGGLDVARLDGVVPQMVNELFRHTTALEKAGTDKFTVSATLIEAQGQHLVDMLAAYNAQGEPSYVKVTGTLQMVGVKRERVYSGRTFCLLVERAMAQSAFASAGGACHRMLTLTLERKRYVSGELQGEPSTTSIHVVDLAGTENFDLEAAKSSRWLNRGVLAMGRIVLALAEGQSHVPYRDYPLTKLIASVFSSPRAVYTGMLACVHVTEESAIETRNTLEYALQASSTDVADTPGTLAQSTARMEDFTKTRSDEEWLQMINDENDEDEVLNRRSEVIETRSGHVFARACGDAAMPLILYLHGAKADARPSTPPPAELSVDHLLKMPREQGRAVDVLTSHRQSSRGPVSGSSDVGPSAVWNKCVECVARAKQSSTASMLDERRGAAKEAAKEEAEAIAATPADEVTRTTSSSSSVAASRLQNATRRQQRRTIGKPLDRQNASPEARHKTAFALHMRSLAHDADDNDADEGSSGYDDRFFKLRAKVSAALLRRQKELAQIVCSLCNNLLLQPRRLQRCRHVLCALCTERSILYHQECPVCSAPVQPGFAKSPSTTAGTIASEGKNGGGALLRTPRPYRPSTVSMMT